MAIYPSTVTVNLRVRLPRAHPHQRSDLSPSIDESGVSHPQNPRDAIWSLTDLAPRDSLDVTGLDPTRPSSPSTCEYAYLELILTTEAT
jgi:hypothetical protein